MYRMESRGVEVTATVFVAEQPLDRALIYQYAVGTAYLIIGLFVYFRRGSAQKARHFYILCLASFISLSFHYTGQLNTLDKVIYFGNLIAGLLAPTLFLHFCLTFPEPRPWFRGRTRTVLLYVPAALIFLVFVAFSSGFMKISVPLLDLRWLLDRAWMVAWTLPYLIGAVVLALEYNRTEDMVVRQQLKWLRNGAFCGILPFAAVLRAALRARRGAQLLHEDERAQRGADPADAGLRHRALPADGRGHHFPPRLFLHAGHAVRAGGLLRHCLLAGQPGEAVVSRTWGMSA